MKTWEDLTKHTAIIQASVTELIQRHGELQSFRDAREWDKDSDAIIALLQDFKNDLTIFREGQETLLQQLTQEHNNKSFFKKILSSHSDENDVKKLIEQTDLGINSIEGGIDKLYEMMDKTPANKTEQKEIADELRQLKKELTLQKREANENLRQTRANARQKTANWTGVTGGTLGKVARYQRTSARLEKERALAPVEDLKRIIEGELIALERNLIWVMHFKGDDQEGTPQTPQVEIVFEHVLRCKYCGRRVGDTDDVCTGCGASV